MASYIYPEEEKPEEAFAWWISPCGGSDLVPEKIKQVFDILNMAVDGVSSWKKPINIAKGSGKKGDGGNPNDQSTPRASSNGGGIKKKNCHIKGTQTTRYRYYHMLTKQSCVNDQTHKNVWQATSIDYSNNALALTIGKECSQRWSQACYHYSSVISLNPAWATPTCPPQAAITRRDASRGNVIATWSSQHKGSGWKDTKYNRHSGECQRDEYPPAYLLGPSDLAWVNSGIDSNGQLVRYLPHRANGGAAHMWKGVCFSVPLAELSDAEFQRRVDNAPPVKKNVFGSGGGKTRHTLALITVDHTPIITIAA